MELGAIMEARIEKRMLIKTMRHRDRSYYFIFFSIFFFFLTNCIEIGKVFEGNTQHKFGDYDIGERQEYKRYLNNKSLKRREKDREIVRRMRDDEKASPSTDEENAEDEERPWLSRMLRRLFRAED